MKTQSNFLLGLIVGASAGAALGLLLAPEKGSINQQKLKQGMSFLLDNVSKLLLEHKEEQLPDNTMAHIEGIEKVEPSEKI
jgi:gas vesicle protein